ncbi:MAG: diacylglycerol kinase [Sphingomonadales bacterium]|jgi:hypothetical protein|nr:diacylglycerol kinase [Sphingomonadales bacterium]
MARVALLSNPSSTGNLALLPRIREFCAEHGELFHYEVEHVGQIGEALRSIARVRPRVLVINGGDGTVQATLTELHQGDYFDGNPPPVAVLPNGKTNLIALDLGSTGDPVAGLARILELAASDLDDHVVRRELIALSEGERPPVLGMFLGGAGLADSILYCRHVIYPLGMSNGLSHFVTVLAVLLSLIPGFSAKFLPPLPTPMRISLMRDGQVSGKFALMIVTTLEKMLLGSKTEGGVRPGLKFMAVDQSAIALVRAIYAALMGRLGSQPMHGVHVEHGDHIRIESDRSSVILDGEIFHTGPGAPITLRPTKPMAFLRLAA